VKVVDEIKRETERIWMGSGDVNKSGGQSLVQRGFWKLLIFPAGNGKGKH